MREGLRLLLREKMWNQQQQPQINVEIKKEGAVAVAIDKDKGSQYALKWAIDNVLNKGQTVTLLHVRQKQSTNSSLCKLSYIYISFIRFCCHFYVHHKYVLSYN